MIVQIVNTYNEKHGKKDDLKIDWGYHSDKPDLEYPNTWKTIIEEYFKKLYGDQPIFVHHWSASDVQEKNLQDLGWVMVDWGAGNDLLRQFGYKVAADYPESVGHPKVFTGILTGDEARVYERAKYNLKMLMEEYYKETREGIDDVMNKIQVAESFKGVEEFEKDKKSGLQVHGMHINGDIYILKGILSGREPVIKTTGVLVHEYIHKRYGYHDEERRFENVLTAILGYTHAKWREVKDALQAEYNEYWMPEATIMMDGEWEYGQPVVKLVPA